MLRCPSHWTSRSDGSTKTRQTGSATAHAGGVGPAGRDEGVVGVRGDGEAIPGNCAEAKARLKTAATTRTDVQKPLRGTLGSRTIGGIEMDQWQYDVSSGARLWYCVDPDDRIVWLTLAAMGHPTATEAKGKRTPRNR